MLNQLLKEEEAINNSTRVIRKRSNKSGNAGESLTLYFKEISKIPLLSRLEEKDLGRRARAGDQDALQKLVTGNLRFVVRIAKRYQRIGVSFLDLINQGNLGLIKAARRFDPQKKVRFTTYALWWIRQMIFEYLTKSAFTLSLPSGSLHALKRAMALTNTEFHGEWMDTQVVAREAGIREELLANVLSVTTAPLSFEQPANDKNENAVGDILKQSTFPPADEELTESEMKANVRKSLERLTQAEREIVRLRFDLEGDGAFDPDADRKTGPSFKRTGAPDSEDGNQQATRVK